MHLHRFRSLAFKGPWQPLGSAPERPGESSREPPRWEPLPPPKTTIFPADPSPGLSRRKNGGRREGQNGGNAAGWGGTGRWRGLGPDGLSARSSSPTVCRTDLGLSLSSPPPPDSRRSRNTQHLGPADGETWERGLLNTATPPPSPPAPSPRPLPRDPFPSASRMLQSLPLPRFLPPASPFSRSD